jgi:hypothetical protein
MMPKIDIFKKIVYVVVLVIALQSCTSKRTNTLESNLNRFIDEQTSSFELRLDTISTFEWDELLIAGPYTELKSIDGYKLNDYPSTATDHDQYLFLGFIHKKRGEKWLLLPRYKFLDELITDKNGYHIYRKNECVFKLGVE